MKEQLLSYTEYNLWANTRMVELFSSCDEAIVNEEVISSFPSIRQTLLHLWDVEIIWLERLKGNSPSALMSKTFQGDNKDIYAGLISASTAFRDFVAAQPELYFSTFIDFTLLTAAGSFRQLPADMIQHCMNHQTMHRGQLITMGRQLGITAFPRTDYIIWVRENQKR